MNQPAHKPDTITPWQQKALEITMRDSLGGLEELANESAYANGCSGFKIIAVEPPGSDFSGTATIVEFPCRGAN